MTGPKLPSRRFFLLTLVGVAAAASPAQATPRFTIVGHGFGHGVGLAQWGSQGLALKGAPVSAILSHYFQGTSIGPAPTSSIRVLLAVATNPCFLPATGDTVAISGTAARTASVRTARLVPQHALLPRATPITDGPTASQLSRPNTARLASLPGGRNAAGRRRAAPAGSYCASVGNGVVTLRQGAATVASGPVLTLTPGQPIGYASSTYRGSLVLRSTPSGVQVVNQLDLDSYVRGVVSRESPASWQPAALQAQAIVARSYALAEADPRATFDVYPDQRSQVYGGVAAETPTTDAAVAATAGQIVLTGTGAVATTFFSSSSGGRTAANEDVWGGPPISYLRSVPDPTDSISPYFTWGPLVYSGSQLGAALGTGRVRAVRVTTNPSRRVSTISVSGVGGPPVVETGSDVRTALGLRSTWFAITMLDLRPVTRRGSGLVIRGLASNSNAVSLFATGSDDRLRVIRRGKPKAGVVIFRNVRVPKGRKLELRSGRSRSYATRTP